MYVYMHVCMYVCTYEVCMYVYIYLRMYIYICTSVLLCVYTHSECGSICQVDAIVMLTWSKVCITKAITISITISIQKLLSTANHTIQKLSFVENWSDLQVNRPVDLLNWSDWWKTGQIGEKLVR